MAITVGNTQTAFFTAGNLIVTKPTGLAVGDTMLLGLQDTDDGGTTSGFTKITSQVQSGAFYLAAYWKIANSSDVAATNFTITQFSGTSTCSMTRISSTAATPSDQFSGAQTNTTNLSTTTITPTVGNSLLCILTGHLGGSTRTVSGYASANNNPTWTEAADFDHLFSSTFMGLSLATGPYTPTTATGAMTATVSGAITNSFILGFDIIPPSAATGNMLMFM